MTMSQPPVSTLLATAIYGELDQVVLVLRRAISCRVAPSDERPHLQGQLDQATDQLSFDLVHLLVKAPR
jgi:hypothetical protein